MAGMPRSVVKRANEILKELERTGGEKNLSKPVGDLASGREGLQMSFFQLDDPILKHCENSSVGRARPCQGRGRAQFEFESRFSLFFP
jgi:DNA mismatch repair protein MutS